MKAVLISIQPKWCELIASGKKTVEVRKTKPKIETPFKCYIYETQGRTETPWIDEEGHHIFKGRGRVIGEFVCDRIDEFSVPYPAYFSEIGDRTREIIENACLKPMDIHAYNGAHQSHGWHISDLVIYDRPRALGGFRTLCEGLKPYQCDKCEYFYFENTESGSYEECCCDNVKPLKRPPQSWCYVEGDNNEHTD